MYTFLQVKVAFPFTATSEDQLSLEKGENIRVIKKYDSGWWVGEKNGKFGVFPASYTIPIDEQPEQQLPTPANPTTFATRAARATTEVRMHAAAVKLHKAKHASQLSFNKGDMISVIEQFPTGWWKGEVEGRVGLFRKDFVEVTPQQELPPAPTSTPDPYADNSPIDNALVLYTFNAQTPAELSLNSGDEVLIVEKVDDEWWYGEVNGKRGHFPKKYVQLLTSSSTPAPTPSATSGVSESSSNNTESTPNSEKASSSESASTSQESTPTSEATVHSSTVDNAAAGAVPHTEGPPAEVSTPTPSEAGNSTAADAKQVTSQVPAQETAPAAQEASHQTAVSETPQAPAESPVAHSPTVAVVPSGKRSSLLISETRSRLPSTSDEFFEDLTLYNTVQDSRASLYMNNYSPSFSSLGISSNARSSMAVASNAATAPAAAPTPTAVAAPPSATATPTPSAVAPTTTAPTPTAAAQEKRSSAWLKGLPNAGDAGLPKKPRSFLHANVAVAEKPTPSVTSKATKAVAMFDYEPASASEIPLVAGTEVSVLDANITGGWAKVVTDQGRVGHVPLSYLQVGDDVSLVAMGVAFVEPRTRAPTVLEKYEISVRSHALWDFEGKSESELTFKQGDEVTILKKLDGQWWLGEHQGKVGHFPKDYVNEVGSQSETPQEILSSSSEPASSPITFAQVTPQINTPEPHQPPSSTPTPAPTPSSSPNTSSIALSTPTTTSLKPAPVKRLPSYSNAPAVNTTPSTSTETSHIDDSARKRSGTRFNGVQRQTSVSGADTDALSFQVSQLQKITYRLEEEVVNLTSALSKEQAQRAKLEAEVAQLRGSGTGEPGAPMRPVSEIAAAAGVSGGEIDRLLKYFETRLDIETRARNEMQAQFNLLREELGSLRRQADKPSGETPSPAKFGTLRSTGKNLY